MKYFIVVVFVLILCSCGEKLIKEPDGLIPKDEMVDILSDLAILNAARNANPKILEEENIEPTRFVFEKYKIDSLQFVTSDTYYASLPKEYEAMYLEVEELLNKIKDSMTEAKKIKDSLLMDSRNKKSPIKKPNTKEAKDSLP